MFKGGAEATVNRAFAFEGELRTWFAQCALDDRQIYEALDHVYQHVLLNSTRWLRGQRLRRHLFMLAQDYVRALWTPAPGASTTEGQLPALPHSPSRATARLARLAAEERQCRAMLAVSPLCYTVFQLHKIRRLSRSEVAQRLSISVAEVERQLALASTANARAVRGITPEGALATAEGAGAPEGLRAGATCH